jgi:hypothetical protein
MDGLVLCLDAGNRKSYPGSGTTWTDISGKGNSGTLTNGPAYSISNGGNIVFDGVDDNIQLGNASNFISASQSAITLNSWIKTNVTGVYKKIFVTVNSGSQTIAGVYFSIGRTVTGDNYPVYLGIKTSNGNREATYFQNLSTTQYSNLCGTYDGSNIKLYLNGELVATQSQTGNIPNTGIARISGYDNNNETWNGNIAQFSIYNRALTAAEVQQNYNALKSRYYITVANDPYISNVITLLHMDGTNGSTTFTDSSLSAITYSRYGSPTISTAQSKFGGASGYFNGTGSIYVSNPNTVFGQISGDFTLECWINWVSTPPGNANGNERQIMGQSNWPESASGNWFWFYGLNTGFGFGVYNGGSGEGVGYSFTWQANRWYHLAVSRSNGTLYLFLDGTLVSSAASTKPLFVDNVREFSIGGDSGGNSTLCNAYIDEVRFTKGIGRYTSSFTPSTSPFFNP